MATTPSGLPYPAGTDKVVDGDDAIHSLASWLDPVEHIAAFAYGTSPAWAQGGGYLVRCGGLWVLQLETSNLNAGGFAPSWYNIGTIPVGARPLVRTAAAAIGLYTGTAWVPVFAKAYPNGTVDMFIPTSYASQPPGGFQVQGQIVWPVKNAVGQ